MTISTGSRAPGASWGVASLCHEPLPILVAYAAHYIGMGAARVRLYFDQPDAAAERALAAIPQVEVVRCNALFWRKEIGIARPRSSQKRQLEVIYHAYQNADVDWLAHIDTDEFLHGTSDMGAHLAAQPDEVVSLQFANVERVFEAGRPQEGLFDGLYRGPLAAERACRVIYGEDARFLRQGLTGHALGKAILRTGKGLIPGIHSARWSGGSGLCGADCPDFTVLHYDGLTALHWAAKLLRFCASPHDLSRKRKLNAYRHAQMEFVQGRIGDDAGAVLDLHDRLKCVTPKRRARLAARGALLKAGPDIAGAVAALDLPFETDLTARGFDAALLQQHDGLDAAHARAAAARPAA